MRTHQSARRARIFSGAGVATDLRLSDTYVGQERVIFCGHLL